MKTFQIVTIFFLFSICQSQAQNLNTYFIDIRATLGINSYYLNEKKLSNKELFRKIEINGDSKKLFITSRCLLFTSSLFLIAGISASIGQFNSNYFNDINPALFWTGLGICYSGLGGIFWSLKIEKKSVQEYNKYIANISFELRNKNLNK